MRTIGRTASQFHVKKFTAAPSQEKREREVLYSPNTLSGRHGRAAKRAFYSIPRAELRRSSSSHLLHSSSQSGRAASEGTRQETNSSFEGLKKISYFTYTNSGIEWSSQWCASNDLQWPRGPIEFVISHKSCHYLAKKARLRVNPQKRPECPRLELKRRPLIKKLTRWKTSTT